MTLVHMLTQEQMDIMNPYQHWTGPRGDYNEALDISSASCMLPNQFAIGASAMTFQTPYFPVSKPVRTGYTGANAVVAYTPNWVCENCHAPWLDNATECDGCGHWGMIDL